MTSLITIAIIWGMMSSIVIIVIGWRVVRALEDLAQAQAFIANKHGGHAGQATETSAEESH